MTPTPFSSAPVLSMTLNIMPEISVMKMMAPEAIMPRGSDWNRLIRVVGNCLSRYLKLAASTTVRLPSAVSITLRVYSPAGTT